MTNIPGPMSPRTSLAGIAVAVLVLGIASIPTILIYGFGLLLAVVAVALSPFALRKIKKSGGTLRGTGMVVAGLICAIGSVLLAVIVVLVVIGTSKSSQCNNYMSQWTRISTQSVEASSRGDYNRAAELEDQAEGIRQTAIAAGCPW